MLLSRFAQSIRGAAGFFWRRQKRWAVVAFVVFALGVALSPLLVYRPVFPTGFEGCGEGVVYYTSGVVCLHGSMRATWSGHVILFPGEACRCYRLPGNTQWLYQEE